MKKMIAALLCIAMVLSLCACGAGDEPVSTTASADVPAEVPTEAPTEASEPAEIYAAAAAGVRALKDLTLDITLNLTRTLGPDTFTEETKQTVVLHNPGTETFSGSLYASTNIGNAFIPVEQTYMNGKLYSRVVGDKFSSAISPDDFMGQFLPSVLLDPVHYSTCELTDDSTLHFADAKEAETWLSDVVLVSAEGTARLDAEGNLTQSTYDARYREGGSDVKLTVTVGVSSEAAPVEAPEDAEEYPEVGGWEAPVMIQKALGYLGQTNSATGICQTTLAMNALNMSYATTEDAALFHDEDGFRFILSTQSVVTDGDSGETDSSNMEQLYNDGVFRITQDGETEENSSVDVPALESYVRQILTAYIPDTMQDTESLLVEETDGAYLISYELNLGDEIGHEIIELFVSPDYIEEVSTDLSTTTCVGTLGIDKATGLPVGYSISYDGTHTWNGEKYALVERVIGSLRPGSLGSYEQITGEAYPADAEEAQPLFYHVTSPDGGEMWMLGTIHAGDARTQNMAPEIYDALNASDALAVEFDINSAAEQLQEDPETAAAVAAQMMYTDGTAVSDHLTDPQLLGRLLNLSAANGTLSNNMLVMKPAALEQAVSQYFLEMGGRLSTVYGVDLHLLDLAEKQGKPILNVESMESQMAMLMGLSDELQEKMLKETLDLGMDGYNAQVGELFELWCQGNEKDITEGLNEENARDPQLQEFNDKVLHERNASMLDTCESYLASGDTVFFAVGLAHLIDPESGLIYALRDAGYTVDLVVGTAS